MSPSEDTPSVHGLQSVKYVSPTLQVREQLLAAIERGDFPSGSLLPSERVLCETFGVSRVSIREAIAGLEAMGLITVRHGRGAFVRAGVGTRYTGPFTKYLQLHRAQLVELLKVRGALDELTAEESALHGTEDGLAKVATASRQFREAVEQDPRDLKRLAELDVAFHNAIAESSGGELLPTLVRELNGLLDESRRMTLGLGGQPLRSAKQHEAIANAILAGNAREARQAAKRHVTGVRLLVQEFAEGSTPGPGRPT